MRVIRGKKHAPSCCSAVVMVMVVAVMVVVLLSSLLPVEETPAPWLSWVCQSKLWWWGIYPQATPSFPTPAMMRYRNFDTLHDLCNFWWWCVTMRQNHKQHCVSFLVKFAEERLHSIYYRVNDADNFGIPIFWCRSTKSDAFGQMRQLVNMEYCLLSRHNKNFDATTAQGHS